MSLRAASRVACAGAGASLMLSKDELRRRACVRPMCDAMPPAGGGGRALVLARIRPSAHGRPRHAWPRLATCACVMRAAEQEGIDGELLEIVEDDGGAAQVGRCAACRLCP